MPIIEAGDPENNVIITSAGIIGSRLNLYASPNMNGVFLGPDMAFHLIDTSGGTVYYEITMDGIIISNGTYTGYSTVYYNATQKKINYVRIKNGNYTYHIQAVIIKSFTSDEVDRLYQESDQGSWLMPSEWSEKQWRQIMITVFCSFMIMIWGAPSIVKLIRDAVGWVRLA